MMCQIHVLDMSKAKIKEQYSFSSEKKIFKSRTK